MDCIYRRGIIYSKYLSIIDIFFAVQKVVHVTKNWPNVYGGSCCQCSSESYLIQNTNTNVRFVKQFSIPNKNWIIILELMSTMAEKRRFTTQMIPRNMLKNFFVSLFWSVILIITVTIWWVMQSHQVWSRLDWKQKN